MRQTLFFIPHEVAGLPLFGPGWLLIVWAIVGAALLIWTYSRHGAGNDLWGLVPILLIVGAAIYFVLPMLEVKPFGLPIRGYGSLMLVGVVAGVGLAAYRARRMGLHPDLMFSLAFWMFLAGIAGARLFYVVEYWDEKFKAESLWASLWKILKFTEGGLVVYGSLIGALLAYVVFSRLRHLPMLAVGDIIAPSMLIGLSIGRLGCLMNGCCYGAVCEDSPVCITFPRFSSEKQAEMSPPYVHQLANGQLHGFSVGKGDNGRPIVESVTAGSRAAEAGLQEGATIISINETAVADLKEARSVLAIGSPDVELDTSRGRFNWSISPMPERSLPVHPTQIYGSLNALLLFFVVWLFFPFRRHDGEALALTLVLYAITRFLLEMVRVDEPGLFGTDVTPSQWVSIAMLVVGCGLWLYASRGRRVSHPENAAIAMEG